jgi:membrane dipeptidase
LRTGLLAGAGALAGPALNLGRFSLFADDRIRVSARAVELVGRSTVIDMLSLFTLDWPKLDSWFRKPIGFGAADLQKLLDCGINVFHPAVETNGREPRTAALEWTAGWNHLLHQHPERLLRIDGAADLKRVKEEGKVGILIGFQNGNHFHTVDDVAFFHGLGQRVSQLTYNERNRIATGCKEPGDGGLTPYGAEIVAAMNRSGMAVDLSHAGERTALETIAASRKPVLISHSNCRALVPHPRCVSDAVIRALAARGGVMGITIIPAFVRAGQPASLEDVLNHFDHVARLVGVEHVGLGSDADVDAIDPQTGRVRSRYAIRGLSHPRRVFELAEGLIRRGYGSSEIEMVLGGNFQRALAEIWNPPAMIPVDPPVPPAPQAS